MNSSKVLGVDIGSVSIAMVMVDGTGSVEKKSYLFHYGKIRETLAAMLQEYDLPSLAGIAATSVTPNVFSSCSRYDIQLSVIKAVQRFHGNIGSILIVGGERFGLIQFDEDGTYRKSRANSSCAAGTGSFLDQQARRLSLAGIEELGEVAYRNTGQIPKIASRCAVFAKTDLIHAQQEGYTIEEICDGLCMGLAKNIVDTLFSGEEVEGTIFFAGGVSKNRAVVRHLEKSLSCSIHVDGYSPFYGAIGAALCFIEDGSIGRSFETVHDVISFREEEKSYYFQPLGLEYSQYPEFESAERYVYGPVHTEFSVPVEVDVYRTITGADDIRVYLGIDIGSTSTKAVLLDDEGGVVAGFYTRTAGRPLQAVKAVLEAIDSMATDRRCTLRVLGAGTTGSGRKFVGKIIGGDLVIDEITAHAKAAYELNPSIDTIIEIGGQDAKFTTMRNGMVTFSLMNTVCAAGTGSFIEEQALKLGCRLEDFSGRAWGIGAPIASDRCTVFMERDINHYLGRGYSVDEILASVLHSVRDNYLLKVAVEANIGDAICFQGATAKNKALVAAFEQKLKKPIFVSKYCHLTGALGVAMLLKENDCGKTHFRGIGLYRQDIPVKSETCELCTNHCKLKLADVGGETVAFGFLCGRDYENKRFINKNSSGFDLLKERKKAFAFKKSGNYRSDMVIGIPAALHIYEEMPLWEKFFDILRIRCVTSEDFGDAVKLGKQLSSAEFCAPVEAMHGHVSHIAGKADHVFLPVYFEGRARHKNTNRHYCYYTQYGPGLAANIPDELINGRCLLPVINFPPGDFRTSVNLFRSLKTVFRDLGFFEVYRAYESALAFYNRGLAGLRALYDRQSAGSGDISVVLLGRPYTIFPSSMNKGIPGMFANLGIKTYYQDMLSYTSWDVGGIMKLLEAFHWNFASKILEAAEVLSERKGAYPVLVTSFKCSPDSFVIEYFKRILDAKGKPYLILQLDEHDSSVGYETRIEAAVRSFRNHHRAANGSGERFHLSVNPGITDEIEGRTILMPCWDEITCGFLVQCMRKEGIDARLLEEDQTTIQKSLRHNTGQCIPLNTIAQECMDYITGHGIAPEKAVLWMMRSAVSCNIKMYPYYIKSILEAHGNGFEKTGVFLSDVTFIDRGPSFCINTYFAYMFGGMLRKLGCKIRPYEVRRGETDSAIEEGRKIFNDHFAGMMEREEAVKRVVALFKGIETVKTGRPKVAIFGDIYVRDNDVMNQGLIRSIEEAGGEVLTTPYSDYIKMCAGPYLKRWLAKGKYLDVIANRSLLSVITMLDRKYYRYFEPLIGEPYPEYEIDLDGVLRPFNVKYEHGGESLDNLIKVFSLLQHHPDVSLFVQTSPVFCCPALVTEAMGRDIERVTGIPVVSVTYDGTGSYRNDILIPYLKYPRRKKSARAWEKSLSG